MFTGMIFLLFLGLIVLGPKKTMEMCTAAGKSLKQFEGITNQFKSELHREIKISSSADVTSAIESANGFSLPDHVSQIHMPPNPYDAV